MKIRISIFLTVVMALGLGAGYLLNNNPFGERPGAVVRSGDFSEIQSRVKSQVVLYTLASCPSCNNLKALLDERGVTYAELELNSSIAVRDEARSLGATQVPFILIGANSVEGFDQEKILALLE